MDWEEKERARRQRIEEERQRFINMSDFEAEKMCGSDRYQRMRYLREIEAAQWLKKIRSEIVPQKEFKAMGKRYKRTKVIYDYD